MRQLTVIFLTILTFSFVIGCEEKPKQTGTPFQWQLPQGFPKPLIPENNPMTVEKVVLGRHIFYDKNLSFNRQQSCASCHEQGLAFGESKVTSVGSTGQVHRRNAQALVNVAYNKTLTWSHDGITSLEQQILLPMFGQEPVELGITGNEQEVLSRFKEGKYPELFARAFPGEEIDYPQIVKALASFVRSLVSLNSPFDQYAYYADDNAISEAAIRGMNLFFSEKLECHHCHGGFNFTQSTFHEAQIIDRRPFHNTGLYNVKADGGYPKKDKGLAEISTLIRDDGRFRAPTLRNIEFSAPYMHDGSIATLSDVLDIYAAGGRNITTGEFAGDGSTHPIKSQFVRGFVMTEQDKADLLAFLATLTDKSFLTNPEHSDPNK